MLLAEIAQLAKVDVAERGDGTLDVMLSGRSVVVRGEVQPLALSRDDDGHAVVSTGNKRFAFTPAEGRLAGLIRARDEKVIGTRERLDAVAQELIERVNAIHVQGQTPGGSGLQFFSGDDAGSIAVSAEIAGRSELIAISRSGLSGDTDIAREIAGLGQLDPVDGRRTLPDAFGELMTSVAADAASTELQLEGQQQVVDALATRLDSLRGVSLDEEAANMARYQNAYTASAKVVAAAQEMFDTVLRML